MRKRFAKSTGIPVKSADFMMMIDLQTGLLVSRYILRSFHACRVPLIYRRKIKS